MTLADKVDSLSISLREMVPSYRRGQALFWALHNIRPDIAEQLRGSMSDPFYDDSRASAFLDHLKAWQIEA